MTIKGYSFKAILGALAVPVMFFALADRAGAQETDILIDSAAELQIDHSADPEPSDSFQLKATFTNDDINGEGSCDGDDPVTQGLTITLGTGACGSSTDVVQVVIPAFASSDSAKVSPLSKKKHGHKKKHKTHFKLKKTAVTASDPSTGEIENATLDGELTVLPTPAGTCGQWTIDTEVSSVDLSALTANPIVVSIGQGDDTGCNDQIQAQINAPEPDDSPEPPDDSGD